MSHEREVEEAVAHCVAPIVVYDNPPQSSQNTGVMRDDARQVAERASGAKRWKRDAAHLLFGSIRADLVLRFGDKVGDYLFADFLTAYERAGRSVHRAAPGNPRPKSRSSPADF
jgi:hypothetical protein